MDKIVTQIETTLYTSPVGPIEIMGSVKGIQRISFLDEETEVQDSVPDCLADCVNQLSEYFRGKRKEFSVKLDLKGTDFQQRVWSELQSIPFGTKTNYLIQATRLGDVKAIRAVASANGRNPIAIIIPCHRVIGSDGSLTGYAGGLWRKKWLLDHENPPLQTSLFS